MDWKEWLDIVDTLSTPILGFLAWSFWKLRTNEIPHIYERLGRIEGSLQIKKEKKK